jgi:hypothetical protein
MLNPELAAERRRRLRTPRAAAVAGLLFAILFSVSMLLIRSVLPEELAGPNAADWLKGNTTLVSLALTLMPFSGIAFLWFMGVVRSHLGELEDQLFSSVMFGSGLLFLAMIFVSAALAGGVIASFNIAGDQLNESGVIVFGRAIMYTITNVYAIRMAGVFMISLGTIWTQTRAMPRPLALLTYALALLLLISINFSMWMIFIFPAWVFVISIYILWVSLRGGTAQVESPVSAHGG